MRNVFALICSFLSLTLFAQEGELQGRVVFPDSRPAASVNVTLDSTSKRGVTDTLGRFRIRHLAEGSYRLKTSTIGYKPYETPVEIKAGKTTEVPVIIVQEDIESLEEVTIQGHHKMRVQRKNGLLEVNVNQTDFEKSTDAWNGLKKVPLLRLDDQKGITVFGKQALVKINGIEKHMSQKQLLDYLESIDAGFVKKIEIAPNPGAEYGTEVEAYINIILIEKTNNYRLGLSSTNGSHAEYFNKSSVNYALNLENMQLYANYGFTYLPTKNAGCIKQRLGNEPLKELNLEQKEPYRKHNATVNLGFDLSPKNELDLTQIFSWTDTGINGLSRGGDYKRRVMSDETAKQFQFAQVWKHQFNDSVHLKLGGYEIIQKTKNNTAASTNNQAYENQDIKGDIPIYIAFVDYENTNNLGVSSAGVKYRDITVKNENYSVTDQQTFSAPYRYSENTVSFYLQHRLSFSKNKSLRFGLRTETSFVDYHFDAPSGKKTKTGKETYTNWLYNVSYNWTSTENDYYSLAFRKQVKRPDYSAINPFQMIGSDVIYTVGDTQLDPAKIYMLSFYNYRGPWTFYGNLGYLNDFISNFYQIKNEVIAKTYQNFKNVYYLGVGFQYNKTFMNNLWTTKTGGSINFYKLEDRDFEVQKETPSIALNTHNSLNLGRNYSVNVDFSYSPASKDGLLMHHGRSQLDVSVSKDIGKHFSLIFKAQDIFKTGRYWQSTLLPNYFYSSNVYYDIRAFSLTLKYSLIGKRYENETTEDIDDQAIDRL